MLRQRSGDTSIFAALLIVVRAFQIQRSSCSIHNNAQRRCNGKFRIFRDVALHESKVEASVLTDHASSWVDLHSQILGTPTGARLDKESIERSHGFGPPHTDAPFRLFGNNQMTSEKDIRVTLYRDHASWCPYCQKVWMFLEEKQIPYRVRKVPLNAYGDKPSWFTRLVDGGKLPAIELDGALYTESWDIMELLDEKISNEIRMIPTQTEGAAIYTRMNELLELEQDLQRAWFSLTFYPVKGDQLVRANTTLWETLDRVNQELGSSSSPWFLGGERPSVVDLQFITTMERVVASVLYWKGVTIRGTGSFDHLDAWLTAFDRRPSYVATKMDYYSHVMAIPSQNGPGYMIPQTKQVAFQICGLGGDDNHGSWSIREFSEDESSSCLEPMTIPPHIGPGYSACHEAAYQLIQNHDRIVNFACRGAGEPGRPSFHAELADPYADPKEDFCESVDVCLRHVAAALVHGIHVETDIVAFAQTDLKGRGGNNQLRENWEAYPDDDDDNLTYYWNYETGDVTWTPPTQQLDTCLSYLRDRVGVPRDMSQPAAMQLRAHLNWAIDMMRTESE